MSEDAGIRFANIAAYRVLVNKNEAKRLQRDCAAAPIYEGLDRLAALNVAASVSHLENCPGLREDTWPEELGEVTDTGRKAPFTKRSSL